MQVKDAAEVVDAVVSTANGAQTAGKIFDQMNTARAAAVANHIADPEGINDAQTASAVIENMVLERAIALMDNRGLQTSNCGLILTRMTSTKRIFFILPPEWVLYSSINIFCAPIHIFIVYKL